MLEFLRGPLLHAGGVDPTGWLWSDWNIEPTIAIGLLVLVAGYLFLTRTDATSSLTASSESPSLGRTQGVGGDKTARTVTAGQKTSFVAGAVVLFIALGPPLDDWSDHYLLLAHMVQHLLLIMLAAPLLLYGTPGWVLEPLTRNRVTNTIGYWLTRPVIAYAVANTVFVLWHVPMFYDMALRSQPVHVFEHVTMLATALLAWWPTLGPLPRWPRLALPLHSLYYFAMTLPGTAVGAFITFADPGLYVPYDTAQRIFGIDLATDQQAAGLLMWVALGTIYLLLITFSFFRWASREEAADREVAAQTRTTVAPSTSIPGDQGAQATS
ncbi:MAG: cytochrome c oxidase assembly protein [Chloroflexi bacterium]|nr:cytochrome c oxidase assembly protein [Chloroflexota bacterium]